MVSIFRSHSDAQSEVEQLLAEAREDYRRHNSAESQGAAREQAGHARTHGNVTAGGWHGHK
ncbi:hypothetical protein [Streptomyces abikoensis]|uniref:Uncharacterized protein n=1 Tax=Streptomyces abikoensis TaxID=97398 RepID=A0ABW7SW50_9ACTN